MTYPHQQCVQCDADASTGDGALCLKCLSDFGEEISIDLPDIRYLSEDETPAPPRMPPPLVIGALIVDPVTRDAIMSAVATISPVDHAYVSKKMEESYRRMVDSFSALKTFTGEAEMYGYNMDGDKIRIDWRGNPVGEGE